MVHNQETESEISQVLELVGKDVKRVISIFQDLKEKIATVSEEKRNS